MMVRRILVLVGLSFFLVHCGNSDHMPVNYGVNTSSNPTNTTAKGPTFKSSIRPIFEKNCGSCHGAGSGYGNWSDFASASGKKDTIYQRVVTDKTMPPAPFGSSMADEDRALIGQWIKAGAPLGQDDPTQTPTPTPSSTPVVSPTPVGTPVQPGAMTYKGTILALFKNYCTTCHGVGYYYGNWLDYNAAFAKKDLILKRVTVDRNMPMGSSRMSEQERGFIAQWVNAGAPLGTDDSSQPAPTPTPVNTPMPTATPVLTPTPVGPPVALTYRGAILPLLNQYCTSCHGAGSNYGNWLDYSIVYSKKDVISKRVTVDKNMPMGASPITDAERSLIGQWVAAGAPQGDDAPAPTPAPTPVLTPGMQLVRAIAQSDMDAVAQLLENGVNPNFVDPGSELTVLMLALMKPNLTILKNLVNKGADAHAVSSNGTSVLALANLMRSDETRTKFAEMIHARIDRNGELYFP